jgi:asparagine N-glycosylation enzyme membrane subunit Stt3
MEPENFNLQDEIKENVEAIGNFQENSKEKELEERKRKVIQFIKQPKVWVWFFLILALILGIYIRSLPMQDHGGNPGLWDITTGDWTLGPDLDPWLFTRIAGEIIEQGAIPEIDTMRNVPLGFDNSKESFLVSYLIVALYKIVNIFGDYSVTFAAAFLPVVMFTFTIIAFFLFVREIFVKKDKESKTKANAISLISTFIMIVIPVFLSRTIAGIPEKESAVFFFIFLSLFLFLRAWKSDKLKKGLVWAILAGIATACAGLTSGLYIYIYLTIALASFASFLFGSMDKNQKIICLIWWFIAALIAVPLPGKISLITLMTSLTLAPSFFIVITLIIDWTLWNTKLSKNIYLRKSKFPKPVVSILITISIGLIVVLLLNPSLIMGKIDAIQAVLFKPITGRWNTTVAENRQPFFTEWVGSFGPFLFGIPLLFLFFFIGSIILFYDMFKILRKKERYIITLLYILFFGGLVFSRYSSEGILNGENFLSKTLYLVSVLLLIIYSIKIYLDYHKKGYNNFKNIDFGLLFLFSLVVLSIISARGAVRLIMVLGPIASIFLGYLMVESSFRFFKSKNEDKKLILGGLALIILLAGLFTFWSFYNQIKPAAYSTVPSHYNQQWQRAMFWVRENTPEDAVFGHWWDYGYWVQSIGNRATVLDGGNAIKFWNYWMGSLTGNNQEEALEFLYNHNTTHFLIDSSDIGKYGAFASIGSDENYDRLSFIGTFLMDEKQTQETNQETVYVYPGGTLLDEDLLIEEEGNKILLPGQRAGIGALLIPIQKEDGTINQPTAIIFSNGAQYQIRLRYLATANQFKDFGSGINATAYLYPKIISENGQLKSNSIEAAMFLSPRLMRGMLAQKYILNDPFDNFPNFKLVHSENSIIIDSLNNQGLNLPEFIHYPGAGMQGPIKIWEIGYTGEEQIQEKYLDRDSSKYLAWKL